MPLDLATVLALVQACAPSVAPATLLSVAQVESGFDPLAIGVNGRRPVRLSPPTRTAAIATAQEMIARGVNADLGLAQLNVRNLAWLGLSVADAFDPCSNLAASARVLAAGYNRASPHTDDEQAALRSALSYYNTGDPQRGLRNGYVAKVTAAAGRIGPALEPGVVSTPAGPTPERSAAAWDVFARDARQTAIFVFSPPPSGDQR
jgi:type IV secretion system protein VirB1